MINIQVPWMPQAPHLRLVCEKSVSHHPSSKSQFSWILHLLPPPQSHSAPTLSTGALPGVCGEWGGWLGASGSNAMLEWNSRPEQGTLLFLIFLITAILTGVKWYHIKVWIYISLRITEVEHLSNSRWPPTCLLRKKTLRMIFCSLKKFFSPSWIFWVLCIFWILTPCQICHLQISFLIQQFAFPFCW